ncbi:MAG TPA: gluconate 2-dehydrogenase subunit 3 family protein [Bacillota bacterium]|nr:gluconate 2-dehydrogenase subunit 3 family protein [Bacillota bacterium]
MNSQSKYPDFDVMREAPEWDDHTREIVKKRLEPIDSFTYLKAGEILILRAIASTLIDDERDEILAFILQHFDSHLQSKIGEDQRKAGTPPEAELIRRGLGAIDETAQGRSGGTFSKLPLKERQTLLGQVEREELPASGQWVGLPQKELFKKLLQLTVEAYYSHPTVWSEIGYAGPAYPRGYVRSELGLADPWEPQLGSSSVSQKE